MDDNNIKFRVNKFFAVKSIEDTDVSFVSAIMRRRLSLIDKCSLTILEKIYSEEAENLVFSSQKGEVERLEKIIEQYTTEYETSPSSFSSSVHNYSAGFFLLNKKKSIPYTAISASKASISSGILASVCSNYKQVLFCYADKIGENYIGFGLNMELNPKEPTFKIVIKNSEIEDNFTKYTDIFCGKLNSIDTPNFRIERI